MPKKELQGLVKENTQGKWKTSDGMTQHEVAEALEMTRSQVDLIEKKALRKLKHKLSKVYKKDELY